MKLYAPSYYQNFVCIADRCRHTCCVGWEIDVDEETMEVYRSLSQGYGKTVAQSIEDGEAPHFRLLAGDRCPHLNEQGLCRIILSMGESYLCEICREHPRFYHDTPRGKEVGVGMACEEAARLILSSDGYADFIEVGVLAGRAPRKRGAFDPLALREEIYAILGDKSLPYAARLHYIAEAYGVSPLAHTDAEWRTRLQELEYLDEAHRELFVRYTSESVVAEAWEEPLCHALAYFVFRHCSAARDASEFRAALGFALFCERLIASVAAHGTGTLEWLAEVSRTVSEELEYSEENTDTLKLAFDKLD